MHHSKNILMPTLLPKNTNGTHYIVNDKDSASSIRTKYLYRLGVLENATPTVTSNSSKSARRAAKSILRKQMRRPASTKTVDNSHHPKRRVVTFAPKCVTMTVPAWHSYPIDVQEAIWMRGKEYDDTVLKNTIEFMSEGCNFDQVLEEEDFIRFEESLVHPAHVLDL
jgi:hypothetical protein